MNGIVAVTDDGNVMFTLLTTLEGKPVQSQIIVNPKSARAFADSLIFAAQKAEEKKNERDGSNPN